MQVYICDIVIICLAKIVCFLHSSAVTPHQAAIVESRSRIPKIVPYSKLNLILYTTLKYLKHDTLLLIAIPSIDLVFYKLLNCDIGFSYVILFY